MLPFHWISLCFHGLHLLMWTVCLFRKPFFLYFDIMQWSLYNLTFRSFVLSSAESWISHSNHQYGAMRSQGNTSGPFFAVLLKSFTYYCKDVHIFVVDIIQWLLDHFFSHDILLCCLDKISVVDKVYLLISTYGDSIKCPPFNHACPTTAVLWHLMAASIYLLLHLLWVLAWNISMKHCQFFLSKRFYVVHGASSKKQKTMTPTTNTLILLAAMCISSLQKRAGMESYQKLLRTERL